MKTLREFTHEMSSMTYAIRKKCEEELRAMIEPFCKKERKHKVNDELYFEYQFFTKTFWIAFGDGGYRVCAVRYYIYKDKWSLVLCDPQCDPKHVADEVSVAYIEASALIALVKLLKRELFEY